MKLLQIYHLSVLFAIGFCPQSCKCNESYTLRERKGVPTAPGIKPGIEENENLNNVNNVINKMKRDESPLLRLLESEKENYKGAMDNSSAHDRELAPGIYFIYGLGGNSHDQGLIKIIGPKNKPANRYIRRGHDLEVFTKKGDNSVASSIEWEVTDSSQFDSGNPSSKDGSNYYRTGEFTKHGE